MRLPSASVPVPARLPAALTAAALAVAAVALPSAPAGDPPPGGAPGPAAPDCARHTGRSFPLAARVGDTAPAAYRAGAPPRPWSIEVENVSDTVCARVHPVVVLVDERRALRPAQVRMAFHAGGRWRAVTSRRTSRDETIAVFDDGPGFRGFTVRPGQRITVRVRLALARDTAPGGIAADTAIVQRRGGDGDWVGESDTYRFRVLGPDEAAVTDPGRDPGVGQDGRRDVAQDRDPGGGGGGGEDGDRGGGGGGDGGGDRAGDAARDPGTGTRPDPGTGTGTGTDSGTGTGTDSGTDPGTGMGTDPGTGADPGGADAGIPRGDAGDGPAAGDGATDAGTGPADGGVEAPFPGRTRPGGPADTERPGDDPPPTDAGALPATGRRALTGFGAAALVLLGTGTVLLRAARRAGPAGGRRGRRSRQPL